MTGIFSQCDPRHTYHAPAWPQTGSTFPENTGEIYSPPNAPVAQQEPVPLSKKNYPCVYEPCRSTFTTKYRLQSLSCLSST